MLNGVVVRLTDDKYVVEALLSKVVDIGYTRWSSVSMLPGGEGRWCQLTASNEDLVCAVFIAQLWCIALTRLELDRDLCVVQEVGTLKDYAEAALAVDVSVRSLRASMSAYVPNLLADAVVDADDVAGRGRVGHWSGR